jgi:tetratricopeptide (TPR) repeat protein
MKCGANIAFVLLAATFIVPVYADDAGQSLLDQATEAKIGANIQQLQKVITLAEQAIEKGLGEGNTEFAQQLITSALMQRAQALSQRILSGQPPQQWPQMRQLAQQDLTKLLTYDKTNGEAHLLTAKLQTLPQGDREQGLNAANSAIKSFTEDKEKQAQAFMARSGLREKPEQKIADLDKAIELAPRNPMIYRRRAGVYQRSGKFDEATKDLRKVIELDDNNIDALGSLAESLARLDRFEEALKLADEAIKTEPDSSAGYELRARIYIMQEDGEKALVDLSKAIELNPKGVVALLLRATIYLTEDKLEQANADLDRVQAINPNIPQLYLLRAGVFEQREDYLQAAKILEVILRFAPNDEQMRLRVAMDYSMAEEFENAIKHVNVAIQGNNESWLAYYSRADIYLSMGEHAKAIEDYERAYEINKEYPNLLNNFAWTLATSTEASVRDGKRAVKLALEACEVSDYKKPHILSTLAAAYAESRDWSNARKWSQKAVELATEDIKETLQKELEFYKKKKPWRENKAEERKENPKPKLQTI